MPRLLLLRHAKSAVDPGLADIDRPLAPRGRRAASLIGEHLARHQLLPDRILCSAARRTRETLAGLLPSLTGDVDIRITRALYEPRDGYLPVIAADGAQARTLLVIGHNPAMQEAAGRLIGSGNPQLSAEVTAKFPTAGLAVIDFDAATWREVKAGAGRIVAFHRPRDLELVGSGNGPGDDD